MNRRTFLGALAAGGSVALAGCDSQALYASLVLEAVDDRALADAYGVTAEELRTHNRQHVLAILEETAESGHATASGDGLGYPPYDPSAAIRYEDRYYVVSMTQDGETPARSYKIEIDYEPESTTPERGEIAFADLPPVDQAYVHQFLPALDVEPVDDEAGDGYDGFEYGGYTDDEVERSVLVPRQQYDVLVHRGERFRLRVTENESETIEMYRYTAEAVAGSDAELADWLESNHLFELSDLTRAQRRILDAAAEEEYREDEPTEAFRDLVERIRAHDRLDPASPAEHDLTEQPGYLLRYEGQVYWAVVHVGSEYAGRTVARETPSEY